MTESSSYISEKIPVGIVSDANFNVIANLEGPQNSYLHYIEEQTNCRVSVHGSVNSGYESDNSPIYILIMSDSQEDLDKAKEYVNNLISTVQAKKQKMLQIKVSKKNKKRRSGGKSIDLPQQLLIAMRYYFPGGPAEPPPPGSTKDIKIHNRKFRQVGKENGWFIQ